MSDFNAGLEAAAKVANSYDQAPEGEPSTARHIAKDILALRRSDAPDAVREVAPADELLALAKDFVTRWDKSQILTATGRAALASKITVSRDELEIVAGVLRQAAARQALGGER